MTFDTMLSDRIDRFDLNRFIEAQAENYEAALQEIREGQKRSHWMWYVFPQMRGLGRSQTARFYGITSLREARAYLAHPLLGQRLRTCVEALQDLPMSAAEAVFGTIDAMKLHSSLTLFIAAGAEPLFAAALLRWFGGVAEAATLALLSDRS